jgi:acetyl-CoA synthetase
VELRTREEELAGADSRSGVEWRDDQFPELKN